MAPPRTDLYESLGLERNASPEAVRKAYRRKALQTHPDRLPQGSTDAEIKDAAEQFRAVNNAYEILSNETNRQLYDKHGVWPPPNVESQQPDPFDYFDAFGYRARHHGENSSQPYAGYASPFDEDPFFTGFNRSHNQFRFTDPFAMFDQMFNDMAGFHYDPMFGGNPNSSSYRGRGGPPPPPPPPGFGFGGSMFGGPSPFESFFGPAFGNAMSPMNRDPFGFEGSLFPMLGGGSTLIQSSSSFGGRNGMRSQNWEMRSQTINGVTHTVKRKTDRDGNKHEERTYPDGRKEVLFNGVVQSTEPAKIESGKKRRRTRDSDRLIECPLDQPHPEPRISSSSSGRHGRHGEHGRYGQNGQNGEHGENAGGERKWWKGQW